MKNIILQHFDGELRPLDELSIANIKQYAYNINAEYDLIRGKPFDPTLTAPCQKVHMLSKIYDEYDNVLMLDIDMFVTKNLSIDVFSEIGIGFYGDVQKKLHKKITKFFPELGSQNAPYWGGAIYKMTKKQRIHLRNTPMYYSNRDWMKVFNKPYFYEDEGIMHALAKETKLPINDTIINPRWCQASFDKKIIPGFIHIRTKINPEGPKQEKILNYTNLLNKNII